MMKSRMVIKHLGNWVCGVEKSDGDGTKERDRWSKHKVAVVAARQKERIITTTTIIISQPHKPYSAKQEMRPTSYEMSEQTKYIFETIRKHFYNVSIYIVRVCECVFLLPVLSGCVL